MKKTLAVLPTEIQIGRIQKELEKKKQELGNLQEEMEKDVSREPNLCELSLSQHYFLDQIYEKKLHIKALEDLLNNSAPLNLQEDILREKLDKLGDERLTVLKNLNQVSDIQFLTLLLLK